VNSNNLPNFVTAGTHQGLRQQMFAVNARYGAFHRFFDIGQYKDKSGKMKWIAWYYRKLDDLNELMEEGGE